MPPWLRAILAAVGLASKVVDAAEPLLKPRPPLPPAVPVTDPRSLAEIRRQREARKRAGK